MFLLQMAGFPGSGKSTLSIELSKLTHAVVIDRDIIKTTMLNEKMSNEQAADLSYSVVFDMVKYYLNMGKSVIIDTPCYYQNLLEKGQNIADEFSASYKFIECVLDDFDTIQTRLKQRTQLISQIPEATIENFNRAKSKALKPSCLLQVNTDQPIEDYLNQALQYIREGEISDIRVIK